MDMKEKEGAQLPVEKLSGGADTVAENAHVENVESFMEEDPWLEKEASNTYATGIGDEPSEPVPGFPPMEVPEQSPLPATDEYKQGFWIGYLQLDKQHYEGWFTEQMRIVALEKEQEQLLQRLQQLQQQLPQAKEACLKLQTEINDIKHRLEYEQKQFERRKQAYDRVCEEEEEYLKERASLRHRYSLLAGILFFIAGFIFIAGDLIISHEIVAYALNIKNSLEAWSFAVGLAMVSVLLKPAYDRLIEIPYNQSKSKSAKTIYVVFKLLMVAFTVVTLLVLGFFRYEAYKTDRLKQSLAQRILQLQASDELTPEQLQALDALSAQAGELDNRLVNSEMGLLSFIFSGVLFAIAAAVCLGISFPVLVGYARLWVQIPWRLKKLQKAKQEKQAVVEQMEQTVSQTRSQLDALQQQLQMTDRPEQLLKEIKDIEGRLALIEEELHRHRLEERIYRLGHGYEQGQVSLKQDNQRVQFKINHLHKQIAELEDKIKQREQELRNTQALLRQWEQKEQAWEAADRQHQEESEALKARIEQLETALLAMEEKKQILEASLTTREETISELEERLSSIQKEPRYAHAAAEKAREEAERLQNGQQTQTPKKPSQRSRKNKLQTQLTQEPPAAQQETKEVPEKKTTRKRRNIKKAPNTTVQNPDLTNEETN